VLDIKNRDFLTWPGRITDDKPPAANRTTGRIQVWSPELTVPESVEAWQHNIKVQAEKQKQAAVIYYDELAALIYKAGSFSEEYRRIQKVGGGLYLSTLSLTQELGGIPSTAYSQAQHFLCWRLQAAYDLQVAGGLLGFKPRWGARYEFWYKNQDDDELAYNYEDIHDFV